jgi:hypothetical protein
MAEFLIYDTVHWSDKLTDAQRNKLGNDNEMWSRRYKARLRKGDIIEVRPDGYYTGARGKGFNRKVFRVLSVPGLPADQDYMAAQTGLIIDLNENRELKAKRKWAIDLTGTDKIKVMSPDDFRPRRKS